MECHPGYAVVLDEEGRFLKTANLNYFVGETVTDIIPMKEQRGTSKAFELGKRIRIYFAMAACLCLIFFGAWQLLLVPAGTLRIQINPDILMTINRAGFVMDLVGLNAEGEELAFGYQYSFKKASEAAEELIDKAFAEYHIDEDTKIYITAESDDDDWEDETEWNIGSLLASKGIAFAVGPYEEESLTVPFSPDSENDDNDDDDDEPDDPYDDDD